MSIELPKDIHKEAVTSIIRYFYKHREEEIGNIVAGALLDFFLEEIGPSIYNKAVADIQERMQIHVSDIDIEFHENEFQYWHKDDRSRKKR
jgi:uncharacterized protein (DUF2164 family)